MSADTVWMLVLVGLFVASIALGWTIRRHNGEVTKWLKTHGTHEIFRRKCDNND